MRGTDPPYVVKNRYEKCPTELETLSFVAFMRDVFMTKGGIVTAVFMVMKVMSSYVEW